MRKSLGKFPRLLAESGRSKAFGLAAFLFSLSAGGTVALLLLAGCQTELAPHNPADGVGAFATGRYRNLFLEAGHSPGDVRKRVEAAYQQLFHGDSNTQAVYFEVGTNSNGPLACVVDIKHRDVRTEGLSYGMMISVQLNKKHEFDAIWNWSKSHLFISNSNHPSFGFFSWQAAPNGTRRSELVAPDGEEYYVTALYFAAGRWGSGRGIYNYREQADELLANMRHRALITGSAGFQRVTAGPLFDAEHHMVLFSPSNERSPFTDPSYHLPAFYELWSRWGPAEDREFWAEAAATSRDFFQRTTDPVTALNPNYARFDGTPATNNFSAAPGNFGFDAWRTEMNWSVDWSWWAKDPRERDLSDKLQAFFQNKGMTNYGCQFSLDGKRQLDNRHATGLLAMNGVASLAATNPRAREFVEALWNTPPQDGIERYYDGLLYMMAMLHCSGEFRIWTPK
jgi:oligosaccharide reducing-end xylanase